jgi:hypothetical protein
VRHEPFAAEEQPANRIASRNETMRLLIERGLEAMPVKPKKPVAGAS